MPEFQRKQCAEVLSRFGEPRRFIQVLSGPRQVGKTTLMQQALAQTSIPHYLFRADAVDEDDTGWIHSVWENVRTQMTFRRQPEAILVIDEIQKIRNWSSAVKLEWDTDTFNKLNLKVFLLGSSRLMIRKGLTESLAGRFELIRMGHWSFAEMQQAFGWTLDQWIYFGGYPGAAHRISDPGRWRQYIRDALIAPAIDKDVIQTSSIYKPALMQQLFRLGCSYSAGILSLTKLLGQLQNAGNVTTLSSYLNLLSEAHLLTGLQKFARGESRKYQSPPKFQVYNNALLSAYRSTTFEKDRLSLDLWDRYVESAVGVHLINEAQQRDYRVFYWREHDKEVDFVLERNGELVAIEVKSGKNFFSSGLPVFREKFHPKLSLTVGSGGLPLEDFFALSPEELFQ